MICQKEFRRFISVLNNGVNTFAVLQEGFGSIGKMYKIAQLEYNLVVPANPFTQHGEQRGDIVYQQNGVEAESVPTYEKRVVTGENGNVCFSIYREKGTGAFSEEEIEDINTILDVVVFHAARWRMINMIRDMRFYDDLTGLPNAGGFLTYVDSLLERKELSKYNAYYFNLTRFSLVNRRFGSSETDKIIVRYADAVKAFLVPGEKLGRLGGDNFTALVLKERTEAFLQLLSGVETYGILGGKELPVRISAVAGVLDIDDSIIDNSSILNDSAMAMNVAKHGVKKPFLFATDEMRSRGFKEKQIASSFMEALHNGEFKVYYQPKVSSQTYTVTGGEALSRWFRDGLMISPGEFIPVIERNGMICMLDFYVLEQVCKDIMAWLKKGMTVGRMSINFSRKHLSNPHLVEDIMDVLHKYDMASRYVEIELTETVDEVESSLLIDFIRRMKHYNIAVSIDDFGTGYSSLNMLRSFAVDVLKIDKSFINDLEGRNRVVLSNIIHMAQELDMEVVAEGVETREQADYLKEIGCETLQGFLFDRPLPREEFETRILNGKYEL